MVLGDGSFSMEGTLGNVWRGLWVSQEWRGAGNHKWSWRPWPLIGRGCTERPSAVPGSNEPSCSQSPQRPVAPASAQRVPSGGWTGLVRALAFLCCSLQLGAQRFTSYDPESEPKDKNRSFSHTENSLGELLLTLELHGCILSSSAKPYINL